MEKRQKDTNKSFEPENDLPHQTMPESPQPSDEREDLSPRSPREMDVYTQFSQSQPKSKKSKNKAVPDNDEDPSEPGIISEDRMNEEDRRDRDIFVVPSDDEEKNKGDEIANTLEVTDNFEFEQEYIALDEQEEIPKKPIIIDEDENQEKTRMEEELPKQKAGRSSARQKMEVEKFIKGEKKELSRKNTPQVESSRKKVRLIIKRLESKAKAPRGLRKRRCCSQSQEARKLPTMFLLLRVK